MRKHKKHNHRRVKIHNSGVVAFGQGGSVLSGSAPYLCFAIKNQNCTKSP